MNGQPINNLGYLLHHLSNVLDRQSDLLLQERLDIGFSQFKILMALKWHQGVQQKQIAKKLGQTEASVSRQIKMLHEIGYLTSVANQKDRREKTTGLSAKGEALVDKAMKALNDYHAPVFERLSPSQQAALQDMLEVMHQRACQDTRLGSCNN